MLLIGAAILALGLANTPAAAFYTALQQWPLGLRLGSWQAVLPLQSVVNDGLMTLFFLLVTLEIRRGIETGPHGRTHGLALPALAAAGGMLMPAGLYAGLNLHHPAALRGWAIPAATDIAFSLAVLRLMGRHAPAGLRLFLATLAILDDLGAIVVIALFYNTGPDAPALLLSGLVAGGMVLLRWLRVQMLSPYLLATAGLWLLLHRAGLHATLAGVLLALALPAGDGNGPAKRLEQRLHRPVTLGVLPLFALLNAGLRFAALPQGAATSAVALGVGMGLLLGKPLGVLGGAMVGCRFGWARLPAGVSVWQLGGGAMLCGIGFTMSLFIGNLALPSPVMLAQVKLGVLAGSVGSALGGLLVLRLAYRISRGAGRP